MGIFNNISRYDDEEEFDINYFLSLLSSQGIHFDQNKNLDMGNKRIMKLANPQDNTDSVNLQYLIQIINDYYKKSYLDSILNQKTDKSQLQNYIQKNHEINMGNNFKIINLKEGTNPQDAINKHQLNQVETNFLKLDGSNKMGGDLNLNGKKLIFPGEIDMNRKLITNLDTKVDNDLSAVNMITLKNKLTDKADNSRVNLKADKIYVDHNFFEIGEDIDMRDKEIYNLQTRLDDLTQSPDLSAYYKDQSRVINKEYIHNRCLINDDKDSDFDLKQKLITNCELAESLYDDATLVPKKYVDNKIKNVDTSNLIKKKSDSDLDMNHFSLKNVKEISVQTALISSLSVLSNAVLLQATVFKRQNLNDFDIVNKFYLESRLQNINTNTNGLLKTDGSNKMLSNLNLGNFKIRNLKEPSESENQSAVNVSFLKKIEKKINKTIQNLSKRNPFIPLMLDTKYWNGDNKIRNIKLYDKNINIHQNNYRCLEFEIEHEVKPKTDGLLYQYKGNITLNLDFLINEGYALTIELIPKWNVNPIITILSSNVGKLKQESKIYDIFVRYYLNFEKNLNNSFITFQIKFDLKHDIHLNSNNYWEKSYIIAYGIRDLSGNFTTPPSIFDTPIYSYNNKIFFTQNLDMNSKFTLTGLKTPLKPNEAVNKLYVDNNISKHFEMIGFNYFNIFDSFIDFNSIHYLNFEWDSILKKYLFGFKNYGLYHISRNIRHPNRDDIDNIKINGINLDLFYFLNENRSFNKFTFFLVFQHEKDKELLINFNTKDPNPLTPIAFTLRIDNSKIYFEPKHAILAPDLSSKPKRSILLPKSSSNPSGKIIITTQNNLSGYLNFDPSYINKRLMLWFTYDLSFNQTINTSASLAKTIIIKGHITMKLNNDDLSNNYFINQTIRLRDDEFINDLSKINKIDFLKFDTTGYKFGIKNKIIEIYSQERLECLLNEIKNGLYIK